MLIVCERDRDRKRRVRVPAIDSCLTLTENNTGHMSLGNMLYYSFSQLLLYISRISLAICKT